MLEVPSVRSPRQLAQTPKIQIDATPPFPPSLGSLVAATSPSLPPPPFLSFRSQGNPKLAKAIGQLQKTFDFRKNRVRSVFLHVGLVTLCVSYILIGAQVFLLIERPVEQRAKEMAAMRFHQMKEDFISNLSANPKDFDRLIDEYTREMFRIFEQEPYAGNTFELMEKTNFSIPQENQWTFASAVLFTSTTVIPVGYGFIAPSTSLGRAFVIIYGMIGIPLALVTMADAGKFLSKFVLDFFEESLVIPTIMFVSFLVVYPLLGGIIFNFFTGMSILDAIYFSLTSIFTIGFGDIMPDVGVLSLVAFNIIGVILVTISVEWVAAEAINHVHYMGRQVGRARLLAEKMIHIAQSLSVNKGIGAGMTQLHALAKFGMFAKNSEESLEKKKSFCGCFQSEKYKQKNSLAAFLQNYAFETPTANHQGQPTTVQFIHEQPKIAFEPDLDDEDFQYMDHGVSTDIRASALHLNLYDF